jgi:hypothetical protein
MNNVARPSAEEAALASAGMVRALSVVIRARYDIATDALFLFAVKIGPTVLHRSKFSKIETRERLSSNVFGCGISIQSRSNLSDLR